MGFKVYLGETPLTVDIMDEKRAALAYNVLFAMGKNDARIEAGGSPIPMELNRLSIVDDTGDRFMPENDHEWNGTRDQRIRWEDAFAERIMDEARKNDDETGIEITMRQIFHTSYSPVLYDGDLNYVRFGTDTFDHDKAVEAFHFLKQGMDPSISVFIKDVDEDKFNFLSMMGGELKEEDYTTYRLLTPDNIFLVDSMDNMQAVKPDHEWTMGWMDDKGYEDFADAVASIQDKGQTMDQ